MTHDNPLENARPGSGDTPAAAMEVIEHTRCRLCGSEDLDDIYSFGDFYVSNFVDEAHGREGDGEEDAGDAPGGGEGS